jgi:hypothetical protein
MRPNQPDDEATLAALTGSHVRVMPSNWIDAALLSLLLITSTLLVWLPLVTYR